MDLSVNLVIHKAGFHRAAVSLIGWEGWVSVNVGQPCDGMTQIPADTRKMEQREELPAPGCTAPCGVHPAPTPCVCSWPS